MKELSIKISILFYSVISLIYCILFILFMGSFIVTMYYQLIKQLIF